MKLPAQLTLVAFPESDQQNRFSTTKGSGPEAIYRLQDPARDTVWGFVVVDNTQRGPGLGGIRLAPDLSQLEVQRLARSMTLKNAAAGLPYGGGKSGLIVDPSLLADAPHARAALFDLFAEALYPLPTYISAPDMGTNEQDIQRIYEFNYKQSNSTEHQRGGAGRPPAKGGIPIDEWGLTAHGLVSAAVSLEHLLPDFSIDGATVVIQGYGNVGAPTANKLSRRGAKVVGASDIHAGLWRPQGLNLKELERVRLQARGLSNYSLPIERKFGPGEVINLLEAPCDILVPAARPDAITAKNADRVQCRIILQGANAPVNKMTQYYLENRRGILCMADFIVNVGGVIGCAVELKLSGDGEFKNKIEATGTQRYVEDLIDNIVGGNVTEIYQRLSETKGSDTTFTEQALLFAEEKISAPESIL